MKQFITNIKNLSQKAAEIKAAMQQVPPKVAEIREAVSATAGQLQQLKSQIEYSVNDLRADDETRLSEVLQEVGGSEEIFLKAGFVLGGVDIELSPVQRLLVHLHKVEEVHPSVLRALAAANQHRRSMHAILSSLLQAQQMADTVELENLAYDEVIIGVGPIPSVRLCWKSSETVPAPVAAALATAGTTPVPVATVSSVPTLPAHQVQAAAAQSAFGPGSFFEKRPSTEMAPAVATTKPVEAVSSIATVTPVEPVIEHAVPAASPDPLARFKKMPNLATHRK
jgi:hypothetical protein